ncbi:MAG: hypothetical protein IT306_15600 [Chloroflexi bacterium]|nr:hypothetical protein [Chloroflexota bacterium]
MLSFLVDREALARLDLLTFVRGDYDAADFWSFVRHCRENDDHHGRVSNGGWYDVVARPVAAFWKQRACYAGADQISFHTASALAVLGRASQEVVS